MKPTSIVTLVTATLIGVGAAIFISAKEPRKPWPRPTEPPPASPIYLDSKERMPTPEEIALDASTRNQRLELEIESALATREPQRREAAFTFLLPELIQVDPQRVVALFDRQKPGEARETLRTEITRQWIVRDLDAAMNWMKSLDERERRASAVDAVTSLAPYAPAVAQRVSRQFDVRADDRGPRNAARE